MEAQYRDAKPGDHTMVDKLTGPELEILVHYDQDKMTSFPLCLPASAFLPRDIIQHCMRAYEVVDVVYSTTEGGYWCYVKGEKDPLFCAKDSKYPVRRKS